MADSISLGSLKTRILRQADMENSDFVDATDYATDPTKAELTEMVRESIQAFYDIMVDSFEDYFIEEDTITTVAGTKDYALPTDFYKFMGLDYVESSQIYSCRQFIFKERERLTNLQSGSGRDTKYRVIGDNIRLLPIPNSVLTFTLYYIPTPTLPQDDADTFDFVQGWDTWVKWDCVIKCLNKEESDVSVAMAERDKAEERIKKLLMNRDANETQRVHNIYDEFDGSSQIDSRTPPDEY